MNIISLQDVPPDPGGDRVYRISYREPLAQALGLVTLATVFIGCGLILAHPALSSVLVASGSATAALAVGLADNLVAPVFSDANWRIRVRGRELFLKYRSFHNRKLSAADRQIIVLPLDEISGARLIRQELRLPNMQGELVQTSSRRLLELRLAQPNLELEQALRKEFRTTRRLAASPESSFLERPIFLAAPDVLMISLENLIPEFQNLFSQLGYSETPTETLVVDCTGPLDKSKVEWLIESGQRKALAQLARARGESVWQIVRRIEDEI